MSLLFPAYLLGLAGLVLPWLLHRFSDQQPPEQLFPSKRFLEPTTPPVSRKQTLRYRALLALRLLALLALCLLFAQPWIKAGSLPVARQQHHMIAVDRSLSMRADGRWSLAIERAERLLDELDGSALDLITFDTGVTVLASSDPESDSQGVTPVTALRDLRPGYSPGDYGLLLQRLDRLAREQDLPVKVWLISDMQHSALPAKLNALYAPAVSELELLSIDTPAQVNVHLRADARSLNGATAAVSMSLLASVSGAALQNQQIERTVRIEALDQLLEQRTVSLTPGELLTLTIDELVLPAQSRPEFVVSIAEPDALNDDNQHRLPVVARQPTGIVLLGQQGESRTNASVFMTTALEADSISQVENIQGSASQLSPDTAHLVSGRDLSQAVEMDVLQFVDTGSNALVYNLAALAPVASAPLDGVGMGVIDEAHPLALGDIDWFSTRFFDVPELAMLDDDRVLLQTSAGSAVLLERSTPRGRLLILNDPLDGLASNLPLQPAFVELMQSMIRYFDASVSVPAQIVVGERLALPPNVQLIDSNGNASLGLAERGQSVSVALERPGIYNVVSARGEQLLRAMLDAEESDLTTLSAESLAAWQARYTNTDEPGDDANTNAPAGRIDTQKLLTGSDPMRQALWQWLLPLAALMLLAEGLFANRRLDVRRDGS